MAGHVFAVLCTWSRGNEVFFEQPSAYNFLWWITIVSVFHSKRDVSPGIFPWTWPSYYTRDNTTCSNALQILLYSIDISALLAIITSSSHSAVEPWDQIPVPWETWWFKWWAFSKIVCISSHTSIFKVLLWIVIFPYFLSFVLSLLNDGKLNLGLEAGLRAEKVPLGGCRNGVAQGYVPCSAQSQGYCLEGVSSRWSPRIKRIFFFLFKNEMLHSKWNLCSFFMMLDSWFCLGCMWGYTLASS